MRGRIVGEVQNGTVVFFSLLRLLSSMVAEVWASELKIRSTFNFVLHGRSLRTDPKEGQKKIFEKLVWKKLTGMDRARVNIF